MIGELTWRWQFVRAAICFLLTIYSASAASLQIEIRHVWSGGGLILDSLRYENSARETLSVTRLSYLLSGFALEREDGGWVELPGQFVWMDAERHRSSAELTNLPAGSYRAIRFFVGLDEETNGLEPRWEAGHPLNPALNGLHWSWQGGYIFLALEGYFKGESREMSAFAYHLAHTANRTAIRLSAPIDLAHGDAAAGIDFDISTLLNAPRTLGFVRDGTSTHSRDGDPIAAALAANLPGAFRVGKVNSLSPEIARPTVTKPLYLPEHWTPYQLTVNGTFPVPNLPRDNPLLVERVALGRRLFHEPALSRDGSISCASCHVPETAFSDPRRFSIGVGGQVGHRRAMPLQNLAWKSEFFWDGRAPSLREQVLMPIRDHAEMDEKPEHVCEILSGMVSYPALFEAAFGSRKITPEKLALALENFLLTLTAGDAKFDRALRGKAVLSPAEQRGFELFMTEYEPRTGHRGADCFHCHGGSLFSDYGFHNNGLSKGDGEFGRFDVTRRAGDRGKFATPSLRNVALRAPYMHDGRFATLEQVVAHYSDGVIRSPTLDPNLAKHPDGGLGLSAEDQASLVAFLKTLTDTSLAEPGS